MRGVIQNKEQRNIAKVLFTCYGGRWAIECCFSCWKPRGLNIEDTHMTDPDRLKKLVAMAYLFCIEIGVWADKEVKKIPVKNHGYKANSFFRYGLDMLDGALRHIAIKGIELLNLLDTAIDLLMHNLCALKLAEKGYKVSALKS